MSQTPNLDLEAVRNVGIRTVNPGTLVDILDTEADPDKPLLERMADFIRQVKARIVFAAAA